MKYIKHLCIAILVLCSFTLTKNKMHAQFNFYPKQSLTDWIDSGINKGLKSNNIAGATFVLIQDDSIRHINGYGVADLETQKPVDGKSTIFRIGSISKTFVATAVMKLYEEGKLKLDNDINNYLKTFQIEYKFNDSITIKNLLTHTAGFDQRNIGWVVEKEEDIIPLAQYLKKRMPPQIRPAGEIITYSNHGFGLLALIVEEVSDMPFYRYVEKMILEPLEMNSSGFKKKVHLEEYYASSYIQRGGELETDNPVFMQNYPTGSFSSTAADMGNYITMFLNYGNYNGNQILDSSTIIKMTQTGFKQYDEAPWGWLLGFQEHAWKGYKVVRYSGQYQGFTSELVMLPEKKIGFFISINSSNMLNSAGHYFLKNFINNLLTDLIPDPIISGKVKNGLREVGFVEEPLKAFSGTYRHTRYPQKTLDKIAILLGFAQEINIVPSDSTLEIVEWNNRLRPVSGLMFNIGGVGYAAFSRNANGEIAYFLNNENSYHKLKWYEPLQFQVYWVGSIVLVLLIFIIVSLIFKRYFIPKNRHLVERVNFWLASLIILFLAMFTFSLKITEPSEFFIGIPWLLKIALVLPFLIISLELVSFYLLIKAFRFRELGVINLVTQSIVFIVSLVFIPWLLYYNLIGFNY